MKSFLAALLLLAASAFAQTPSQKHPFTFEDMMKLKRVGAPVPSPDGKWVVFDCVDVDLEANTRISHLWIVPADGGIWSPDGKNIVFVSAVYPDCKDDACNKQRDEELKKSKVKAKIFSRLFYRHWSAFTEFKRSHLFVVPADAGVAAVVSTAEPNAQALGTSASTTPRDL